MSQRELIADSLDVWAPTWPRNVNRQQRTVDNRRDATQQLLHAQEADSNSPFISVYSFPEGHTKANNIPRVDTLFIDFDFEGGDYDGDGDYAAWRRDISHLLVRVRKVAQFLRDHGRPGWRAALSGHKGVHLFLDFPAVERDCGSFDQYVTGLNDYADALVEQLADETGIGSLPDYVDVTSSDLGRLCRVPNTIHGGASSAFGERRYCVPVTIPELARITTDDYEELTQAPRAVPYDARTENAEVGEVVERHIRAATGSSRTTNTRSDVDYSRVDEYRSQSNDDIELSDIEFLTADRPCVWRWYQRDDKYRHGYESHYAEMWVIRELLEHNVPIDVIKEFLNSAPEYDERYSEQRIKEIISRDYSRFSVSSVLQNAPEFVGHPDCGVCQSVMDADEISV